MAELLDDPDVSAGRVEAVRAFLATAGQVPAESIPLRVAASVTHLGLVARTLSPVFALAVMGRPLSPIGLRDLYWQPTLGSMFALSIPDSDSGSYDGSGGLIPPSVLELSELMGRFGVSPRVLRGNVASALNGACIALSSADPAATTNARAVRARALSESVLADAWRITVEGRFQRRSCCLIYQAAPDRRGALCGDCVLLRPVEPD
ncbi:(2Fe-2S)-binding protein [Actinospica robiniae]|uniref:(2Fe-2S)-binding protein n=1 Tax=Actinospica robiniae TaxID=304901 RepID=UPI00146FAC4C|nr:(2Fe-2S)-binding protein [Actinospica robiniae]